MTKVAQAAKSSSTTRLRSHASVRPFLYFSTSRAWLSSRRAGRRLRPCICHGSIAAHDGHVTTGRLGPPCRCSSWLPILGASMNRQEQPAGEGGAPASRLPAPAAPRFPRGDHEARDDQHSEQDLAGFSGVLLVITWCAAGCSPFGRSADRALPCQVEVPRACLSIYSPGSRSRAVSPRL